MTTSIIIMTTTKIWIVFIIIQMTEIVSCDTNVALNGKVSLFPPPSGLYATTDLADYATDGKQSTRATTGSMSSACISIDLGRRFQVVQILVTSPNLPDLASCQFGFIVGLTNTKPTGPNVTNEFTCYAYIGPPIVPSRNYSASCSMNNVPLYQYVVYSIPPTVCQASVMELAVYAVGTRISTYKTNVGQRLQVVGGSTISNVPRVDCVLLCERAIGSCHSFNYRSSDSSCELNYSPSSGSSSSDTSDPSWNWWLPTREFFNL